ncbi:hypothetical protein ATL39_3267 [Sinobaca qinghaiensis]|uniref:Uncharacterized protein n=1 Tax=Sinobaca qinghaiensis TaxID=342944 RepID=A0A419UW57_9BACL|nr:hypothetical protein [Sinobaca qinghaiensis]RKD68804.1 hypothetical protein ATL39_3267 [Sinobaca qinghaiensis]
MFIEAVIFGIAIFIGWMILDLVREKSFRKESIYQSFITGIAAALGWIVLELIF